jgi:hypothetical protein
MASPFLYYADDRLSLAELSAARLDGDVVELGDAYIPADAVETAALRAGSLLGVLGELLAATHVSAAWIHGALPEPPAKHTVQRAVARRIHRIPSHRIVYRDLAVDPGDLQRIGSVWVTTPVRTLVDLTRVGDADHTRAARLLAQGRRDLVDDALARLESGALPYKRTAIALLQGCIGLDAEAEDVTTR